MVDPSAAVKYEYKALRFFRFEEVTAAVGDGLLYLQLGGTYLIWGTLLYYSSIVLWHVGLKLGNKPEKGNSGLCLVAAFNGGHSPSYEFPNYPLASATSF
jgi:hypothetical protein